MSESSQAELALWQSRVDEMQVAMERLRDERDELRLTVTTLREQMEKVQLQLQHALSNPTPY